MDQLICTKWTELYFTDFRLNWFNQEWVKLPQMKCRVVFTLLANTNQPALKPAVSHEATSDIDSVHFKRQKRF